MTRFCRGSDVSFFAALCCSCLDLKALLALSQLEITAYLPSRLRREAITLYWKLWHLLDKKGRIRHEVDNFFLHLLYNFFTCVLHFLQEVFYNFLQQVFYNFFTATVFPFLNKGFTIFYKCYNKCIGHMMAAQLTYHPINRVFHC